MPRAIPKKDNLLDKEDPLSSMSSGKKSPNEPRRQPVGTPTKSLDMAQKIRMAQGKQRRLDASYYENLPEYQNKSFMWINDMDGDVEKWLHLGAELVPRQNKSMRYYEGFTDRAASEWEMVPGVGSDDKGNTITAYLLMMDADLYHQLKIQPQADKNNHIRNAMGVNIDSESKKLGGGLQTYSPNLPTGGQGFQQIHTSD